MSRDALRSTFNDVRIDDQGEFVCKCGYQANVFTVKKTSSPYRGQNYYACAKYFKDPTCCKTKIWFDEIDRVQSLIPQAMQSPRTPRKQVDIREYGQYTAPRSSKRKADTQSFDSGLGDLTDNDSASPSVSGSAKKARPDYANAATQTGDTAIILASAARSTTRSLPRRRLFDDYLPTANSKPVTEFDPFASRRLDGNKTGLGPSIPPSGGHPRHTLHQSKRPTTTSNNRPGTVTLADEGHTQRQPLQTENPTTPPASRRNRTGLFTPPTGERSRPPTESEEAKSPTKINHKPQPLTTDSDDETYGWDDDLDRNILDVVANVENP